MSHLDQPSSLHTPVLGPLAQDFEDQSAALRTRDIRRHKKQEILANIPADADAHEMLMYFQ
jgi:hypothetical protein